MIDPRASKRTTEDLELIPAEGGPLAYTNITNGPLRYVEVANDSTVLGYLWAADADDAAGFVPRAAAGDEAFNAWVSWKGELREAKVRRLQPSQALTELAWNTGGGRMGRVVPGSEEQAPSLAALKELASRTDGT